MRNFPHQVNQIPKLIGAIRVAAEMLGEKVDITDDGVYGYALADAGVYSFRGLQTPAPEKLKARIAQERTKPRGSQGARTFARDLRRTLLLLGFLQKNADDSLELSSTGSRVLALGEELTAEGRQLWIHALLSMQLADSAADLPLHPAQAMLQMVSARPGIEKRWVALALDMQDDSQQELNRVLELIDQGDFAEACSSLEVSDYEAANAVKIIPSLLEQVGVLSIDHAHCKLTPEGLAILAGRRTTAIAAPFQVRKMYRRPRRDGRLITSPDEVVVPASSEHGDARTPDEQLHSALKLEERTREHQELVRLIVSQLRSVKSVRCSEDAFDILAEAADNTILLLLEVKTVRSDGLIQARVGVGQLLYYEFFDVRPQAKGRQIVKVLVFNDEPGDEVRAFLEHCGVFYVTVLGGLLTTIPHALEAYLPGVA